jgi:predicted ArsR family transcriptional regulator
LTLGDTMAEQHQAAETTAPAAPANALAAIERLVPALQDPTRRGILLGFYDDPRPRSVDEVAAGAGVHRTVAFGHLERLVTLGFLGVSQRRGLPGKPAKLYRLVAGPLELHHPARQFATLAGLLAAGLERFGEPGVAAAREAGRRHGAALGGRPASTPAEALVPLALLGGDYEVRGERVLARNCIFREACASAPEVVCQLHAGMIEGALAAAGTPRRVEPGGGEEHAACVYDLRKA